MCDTIRINNKEIDTIREDGACLCNSSLGEIGSFIFKEMNPKYDDVIIVKRTCFGWEVKKINERNKNI